MSLVLRYAEQLPPVVRAEFDSLVAQLRSWGMPAVASVTLTCQAPGTLSAVSARRTSSTMQRRVHVDLEITVTVATADTAEIYVPLPYQALASYNTAAVFRATRPGVGADGFHAAIVYASQSRVVLVRGDGSNWVNGNTYVIWCQLDYFRE